jgi:hypothetical protein
MNIPSLPKIEDLSQHINDERKMLEERLAVLRASDVDEKLRQFNSLRTQLEAIHKELVEIRAGRLVRGPVSNAVLASQSLTQPTAASAATRRGRVSREEAFSRIVTALKEAGAEGLNRSSLSEKTGLGVPKVDEAIKSKKEMFEVTRGPRAMVRLVDLGS